jgi:hypothetical protein
LQEDAKKGKISPERSLVTFWDQLVTNSEDIEVVKVWSFKRNLKKYRKTQNPLAKYRKAT